MSQAQQGLPGVDPAPQVSRGRVATWRKPSVEALAIDVGAQAWQRSGDEADAIEIALVGGTAAGGPEWVLMRVAGDPAGRVLVYDRHEWECFLDGAREGEFDDAVSGQQAVRHCDSVA
jgi:Domain of unknown function (DUF397)